MFSCFLRKGASPLQGYPGYSLCYRIPLRILQNAFCSKISGDFPIENKQDKVEQIRILLRNYGLSDIQISTISQMHPKVFRFHPQNVILPKLKFLSSIGLSSDILHKIIVNNPWLLQRSLENKLIPCYNLLKNVPISNKDIVRIIKRNSRILGTNVEKIAANVDAFRQMGVPQSSISFVMVNHPSLVLLNCEKLKRCVEETLSLGFNRLNTLFVQAVYVLCGSSKETWENKVKVYKSFGLSETEVQSAFRAHPLCMRLSVEKISRGMDFFVNEMGWSPTIVARWPAALFYHLEKSIIPRCQVIKVLMQKGLVKEHQTLMSFLGTTEEQFLDKYVSKYMDVLPELRDIYRAGMIFKNN
ncbi:uncharacterized protein LOC111382892 [Olea europaea var. sylvestris]|uniref:uncharacterized protein LOC111382892 n=1 Tax=Olea europaea var. sylvestris TaxID=158386 RepID=UPI000C1D6E53|nr:uncharacterized protein LOC111382892 [Olea europaea var. sylvestris]